MNKQTVRARFVALAILLVLTLSVYINWRANEAVVDANTAEHIKIVDANR